jgi:hypothetical protein
MKNTISILVLASFLFSQVFAYGQTPDVPKSPLPQHEKGSGPHALGLAAKEPPSPKRSSVKWLILGGLVVAAGIVLYLITNKSKSSPAEKIGSIAVNSDPTGAKVFLDGSDTGQLTNCALDSVKAGLHNLRIDLESFGRWEGQVEVKENQPAQVSAKLAPYKYVFVAKWGSYGTGDGQFYRPSGLAIDGADNLYVSDSFNNRIQKFRLSTETMAAVKITYTSASLRKSSYSSPAPRFLELSGSNSDASRGKSVPSGERKSRKD